LPIIETNPKRAFAEFEAHIEEVVRSVLPLPAGIKLSLSTRKDFGVLEFVRGGIATAARIESNVGPVWLSINQELEAVRERTRRYRVRTRRYAYRLREAEGARRAFLRWEYDSSTPDEGCCRHHMHAQSALALGGGTLSLESHLPTGWVLIEHVMRFLFHDLHVEPRTETWPQILRASETKFYEQFTSKRYKHSGT